MRRTYGKLKIVGRPKSNGKHTLAEVRCKCGTVKTVRLSHLTNGGTNSCGCMKQIFRVEKTIKHGHYSNYKTDKIASAYGSMLGRCYRNRNASYYRYGAIGIRVCKRWLHGEGGLSGIECFAKDMGEPPSPKHSLDRRKNSKNYSPDNCRWATAREQSLNRSTTRYMTAFGRTQPMIEWCNEFGFTDGAIYARLKRFASFEEALTAPRTGRWAA